MTDNFGRSTTRRSIVLETRHEALLDQLHCEIAELRASRERLVLAADADRRSIERELHDGVQQHLVALAVNLQLAGPLGDTDPAAAKALLEEMGRDVRQALSETAQLAQRIYPPLLDGPGLAAALRSAAVSAGISASVDVAKGASYPAEIAETIYLCYLDALDHATGTACTTVVVRDEGGAVAFEIGHDGDAGFDRLRDRVEALGGTLTIRGNRLSGSLPLAR